jgi:homoserine O-acetyltransferase
LICIVCIYDCLVKGKKFLDRFDALSYVAITQQMDTHDVGRGRGGVVAALQCIQAKSLVMGMDSDLLYPVGEQETLAKWIPKAEFALIKSGEGHDGFLIEQEQVAKRIQVFLSEIN